MQARGGAGAVGVIVLSIAAVRLAAQAGSPARPLRRLSSKTAGHLLVSRTVPKYPPLARANYIEGQVELDVMVTPEGRVTRMRVVRGEPVLAAAALEAVGRWAYRPFIAGGAPVGFCTDVSVNFALHRVDPEHFPPHPDRDFERQVRPPEVLERPAEPGANSSVLLRVLVGEQGQVLDVADLSKTSSAAEVAEAEEHVRRWRFRSARWGNFEIPWYSEVNVAVRRPTSAPGRVEDPPDAQCE